MKHLTHPKPITHIITSLINGQYKQSKNLTQKGCRTLPEKQAHLVGQVVGALMDQNGFHYDPDLAVIYLNLFDSH